MATRTGARTGIAPDQFVGENAIITWSGLLNGDNGAAETLAEFADKCIQVIGTFGAGGTIIFEGSNDGTNWVQLNNTAGTAISLTAAGMRQVLENPAYVRPRVTAGDGTTNLTMLLFARRGRV